MSWIRVRARTPLAASTASAAREGRRIPRLLAVIDWGTGAAALVGGGLMVLRPDGSLLGLPHELLDTTPFADWRLPGLLLAGLVGFGFVAAGLLAYAAHRHGRAISVLAAAGLIGFELVEWQWIGFHPLQAVVVVVGTGVVALAVAAYPDAVGTAPSAPGAAGHRDRVRSVPKAAHEGVDLVWLPLGAGGHIVRSNGRVYERLMAWREGRKPSDLYHSALQITLEGHVWAVEMTPVWRDSGDRGVIAEGAVGSRSLGRWRPFRYEVRCWRDGTIPDAAYAVSSPLRLTTDAGACQRVLEALPGVPSLVWGRDELGAGEMWNSNSVIAWVLERADLNAFSVHPPVGGRAPGWQAGIRAAAQRPHFDLAP